MYKPMNPQDMPMPVGVARKVDRFVDKRVQFHLEGAWDVKLEGTVDDANWVTIQNNIVAGDTIVEVPTFWSRLRVSVNVSGGASAYSAVLGGLEIRQ